MNLDADQFVHDERCLSLHADRAMRINVQCHRGFGVTQDLGDNDDWYFMVDHQGGGSMAQVMKTYVGQTSPFQVGFEVSAQIASYHRGANFRREDQVIFLPVLPCPFLCLFNSFLLAFEFLQRCRLNFDLANACIGLGFLKDHAMSIDALSLTADKERCVYPVHIFPFQTQDLSHAHAGSDGEVIDSIVGGESGGVQEFGNLALIQYLHFFLFPAWQDGTLGGIGFHQALKDGIFERDFENGVNVAHAAASNTLLAQLHIEEAQLSITELIKWLLTKGGENVFVDQAAIVLMGFQAYGLFLDLQPILKEFICSNVWACSSFYIGLIDGPLNRTKWFSVLTDDFIGGQEHVSPYPYSLLQVSYVTSECGCVKSVDLIK